MIPLFLLDSIALYITNTISACHLDFHIGQINLGMFVVALTSRCSGISGSSMPLSCSIWDSMSAAQLSSLSVGISRLPIQFSQLSVSVIHWGVLSSSLWTGWRSIHLSWWTFNIQVRPAGWSFGDEAGGQGDLSDHLNAAAPSCWRSDQDALVISSVTEIYPTAVICLFREWDFFCVAGRLWLPCSICKKSWTFISNNSSFCQKHPGGPDGSDGSDGTSYPLMENYTLPVAQATGRIAYVPPVLCGDVNGPSEGHVCYTLRRGCSYAEAVYTTPGDVKS